MVTFKTYSINDLLNNKIELNLLEEKWSNSNRIITGELDSERFI